MDDLFPDTLERLRSSFDQNGVSPTLFSLQKVLATLKAEGVDITLSMSDAQKLHNASYGDKMPPQIFATLNNSGLRRWVMVPTKDNQTQEVRIQFDDHVPPIRLEIYHLIDEDHRLKLRADLIEDHGLVNVLSDYCQIRAGASPSIRSKLSMNPSRLDADQGPDK